jgi:predicted nucleic-acid-binding protein
MIGLDTNVVVRYLVQDDPRQSVLATRFIEQSLTPERPGLVTSVVLCEICWVLAECYGADRKRIRDVIEGLLTAKQVVVERAESAWKALRAWDASAADFSDALIGQTVMVQGGSGTVTFDRTAARLPGFQLLQ